jgi:hypothetical protein
MGSTILPPKSKKKFSLSEWCQDHALIPLVMKQLAQKEYNMKYAANN